MRLGIGVAILVVVAFLRSGTNGQNVFGTDWLHDLSRSIGALNRNIQENVRELNQRVADTVQTEVAQVRRLTDKANEGIATGTIQTIGGGTIVGGNNVVATNDRETTIVQSGRTSNGNAFVRHIAESVDGDTLRHVDKIYYPATNATRVYGYTIDLKDVDAKPVPIDASTL